MAAVIARPLSVLFIFGTRPEAIKLAPVIARMRQKPDEFKTTVAVTAQHREMLDQVLSLMKIRPDFDLGLMRPGQSLAGITSGALLGCERIVRRVRPHIVLVQGDTSTTLAGALAAFYQHVPVGHVEAGLRTFDMQNPFPEEGNRRMVGLLANWHFAATAWAAGNLRAEGVPNTRIFITGNPVVDALRSVLDPDFDPRQLGVRLRSKLAPVVVTAHRRESFGRPLEEICRALNHLARRHPERDFIFPVHRNPTVRRTVRQILKSPPTNLHCLAPLPYPAFINLLSRAAVVLTDSGGIQEEAPALGVPALVLRKVTERPEALRAGARLVPPGQQAIIRALGAHLRGTNQRGRPGTCPFGDGRAAERITQAVAWACGLRKQRPRSYKPPICDSAAKPPEK